MPLVSVRCPECGGTGKYDAEKRLGVCEFCKQPFVVEEAIQYFNTTYNITNNNEIKADVVNVYDNSTKDFVIKAGVLLEYNGEAMDVMIPDNVSRMSPDVFIGSNIRSIIIPDSVEEVGDFVSCTSLVSIQLPKKYHGKVPLFKNCKSLREIVVPEGIAELPERMFEGCTCLEKCVLPSSLRTIGRYTFHGAGIGTGIKEIVIPDSVTVIEGFAFSRAGLQQIVIPNSVTIIGEGAFCECIRLEKCQLPQTLKRIGPSTFKSAGIKTITVPRSVEEIYADAFAGCTNLKEVILNQNENIRIAYNAFNDVPDNSIQGLLKKRRASALMLFDERIHKYWNGIGTNKCPFCENKLSMIGKCKFSSCVSWKKDPDETISEVKSLLGMSTCPFCERKDLIVYDEGVGFLETERFIPNPSHSDVEWIVDDFRNKVGLPLLNKKRYYSGFTGIDSRMKIRCRNMNCRDGRQGYYSFWERINRYCYEKNKY